MANRTKIAVVGAGSASFGGQTVRDFVHFRDELRGSTIVLTDINPVSLEKMARFMKRVCDDEYVVESTRDLNEALDGAQFVFNATAVKRNELWRADLEIPRKYGIMQPLGENGGPGSVFFTMRSMAIATKIARAIMERCPTAQLINYSNPESRIVAALGRLFPKLKQFGLCHGIFIARDQIARDILGVSPERIDVWGAGVNHFQWILHLREKATNRDLYPDLRQEVRWLLAGKDPENEAVRTNMIGLELCAEYGFFPSPGGAHIAEQGFANGFEYSDPECVDRAEDEGKRFWQAIDTAIDPSQPLAPWWREPSGEKGVEIVASIVNNTRRFIESAVVCNHGAIPNLPEGIAVEVPVVADGTGVYPVSLGPLPEVLALKLEAAVTAQKFAVHAAIEGTREAAWRAFMSDVAVHSRAAAKKAFNELWEINQPYIMPLR